MGEEQPADPSGNPGILPWLDRAGATARVGAHSLVYWEEALFEFVACKRLRLVRMGIG